MLKLTSINKSEALRYMGYGKATPEPQIMEVVNTAEKNLLDCISPKYLYKVLDITPTPQGVKVNGTTLELTGSSIVSHLENCSKIILMCATLSIGADKLIKMAQIEDMVLALATDSLASACIEQVCDYAEKEAQKNLEGYFTWRFSPGYGDLPIALQKDILNILDAPRKIGLCTTDSSLLIPTKSVTAIIGVSDLEINRKKRGCTACNLKDVCKFRKDGEHCV